MFYIKNIQVCYINIIALIILLSLPFVGGSSILFILMFLMLFSFLALFLEKKHQKAKNLILNLYARIEEELKNELTDVDKITLLDKQLIELDSFLFKYEGIKKRQDTMSSDFRLK